MPKITIELSEKSIQDAIKQINDYKQNIIDKTELFVKELAEVGIPVIDRRMEEAEFTIGADGIASGANTSHYTHIDIVSFGGVSRANLVVEGQEILFIEFGSGVYFNGQYGSSPHPLGEKYGYRIGSYGKGYGKQKIWGYYAENGELILTHGVAYTMPMYNASLEIRDKLVEVAKKVFES